MDSITVDGLDVPVAHVEALMAERMPSRTKDGLWRTYECEGLIAYTSDGRVFYQGFETSDKLPWEQL